MSLFDSLNNTGIANGNAMVEQFESTFSSYTEELKNTGNRYSTLDAEYIEDGMLDDLLMVDPLFGEVLERDADDMPEHIAAMLENMRGLDVEEISEDLDSMRAAMAAGEYDLDEDGNDDPEGKHDMATIIMILAYVKEEKTTGVSLPKVSDPVE